MPQLPPGFHPLATPDDCADAEAIAKADPKLAALLKERYGVTDMDLVAGDPWSIHTCTFSQKVSERASIAQRCLFGIIWSEHHLAHDGGGGWHIAGTAGAEAAFLCQAAMLHIMPPHATCSAAAATGSKQRALARQTLAPETRPASSVPQ